MSSASLSPADLQHRLVAPTSGHAPLVLDLRSRRQFRQRHIPGSHNISAASLLSTEPPEQDLILISDDGLLDPGVAAELWNSGFHRRIEHLQGGLSAWQKLNLPLEGTAPQPSSTVQRLGHNLREPWLISLLLLALATTLQHGGTTLLASAALLWGVLAVFSLVLQRSSRQLLRRYS